MKRKTVQNLHRPGDKGIAKEGLPAAISRCFFLQLSFELPRQKQHLFSTENAHFNTVRLKAREKDAVRWQWTCTLGLSAV